MSQTGSYYVPVEANAVMPMAEGGSGDGYEITGYYVNWDSTGITGNAWSQNLINAPYSPFAGLTLDDINKRIAEGGNFNTEFSNWGASHGPSEEDQFIDWAIQSYGYTDKGGCIGDRLY